MYGSNEGFMFAISLLTAKEVLISYFGIDSFL